MFLLPSSILPLVSDPVVEIWVKPLWPKFLDLTSIMQVNPRKDALFKVRNGEIEYNKVQKYNKVQ